MKKSTIRKSIPALSLAALATGTAGNVLAATHAHASSASSKSTKIKGSSEDTRWGPVQVVITVKNKKITNVSTSVSPETMRSQMIDDQAVPMLKQETLDAQNAKIDLVSGATITSEGYVLSLQSAIKKAQKKKLLK